MMILKALVLVALIASGQSVRFVIRNNENGPIWVGIQGNAGKHALENGGFNLDAYNEREVNAPDDWAGRFWARTWCYWDNMHCDTGDCGNRLECRGNGGAPPATLVEITLRGWGGKDYYDVSLVDGFNLKASIEPADGHGDGGRYSCKKSACNHNINDECPNELRLIGAHAGYTIGCKSACLAFNTDQYCCRNYHGVPERCRSSDWPVNYPSFFKQRCPDAYSYAYDDNKSTFTCTANTYRIVFG